MSGPQVFACFSSQWFNEARVSCSIEHVFATERVFLHRCVTSGAASGLHGEERGAQYVLLPNDWKDTRDPSLFRYVPRGGNGHIV